MPAERPVRQERPVMTPDQYARAESRQGVVHPLLTVFDNQLPAIERYRQGRVKTDGQAAQRYVADNLGFLADAVAEAEPFTLEPEELVAVWSRAMELFPDSLYSRYALAGIVSSAYATQGLENPAWRQLPRRYLETGELPEGVAGDRQGLSHVVAKFGDVDDSLDELNRYVYGSRDSGTMLARDLVMRERAGDVEAGRLMDELIEKEQARKTPLLSEIGENFGNGFSPLRSTVKEAMDGTPEEESLPNPADIFDATIAKRHGELLHLSDGLRQGLDLISDLDRVNELLAASPRPDLEMTERLAMMPVDTVQDIGRHVNNFVPSMCAFGMPVYENRKKYSWSDEMEYGFVGRRDYTEEERATVFLMGARGDYDAHFAFAEANGIDEKLAHDLLLQTHVNEAAFMRMWILMPEFTEELMAACLDRDHSKGYGDIDAEIFVAYQLMSRLVDKNDRKAIKEDGNVDTWLLCH